MIDIHTHLFFSDYDADREETIKRAFDEGVTLMISVGTSPEDNIKAIEIARMDEQLYASIGLHPHFFQNQELGIKNQASENKVLNDSRNDLKRLVIANQDKVVAIGEAGLDYCSRTSEVMSAEEKAWQKQGLFMQMELAQELGLPMILHCREAYADMFHMLLTTHYSLPIILHCYMADVEMTKQFLTLSNTYFSFTGNITYPVKKTLEGTKDDLRETVKLIPLERLLTETDCPFLPPQSKRGQRNEPSFVREIVQKIADIQGISSNQVTNQTRINAKRIFFQKH
ncbi:TatD family hydrolase [bacterium]|nr:TatD family hydrolase [bacterium]